MHRLNTALIALLALSACKTTAESVTYPTAAMPGLSSPTTISAAIYKPEKEGRYPAVMILHGCGGVSSHHHSWAQKLASWGYVAAVVDSFGSRGYGNLCSTPNPVIYPKDRISDIIGAAEYLNAQPYVREKHLAMIGFSHGGWTIMKAIQEGIYLKEYGVRGAVAYYPYCHPKDDAAVDVPLLILMGEKDAWTPADRCRQLRDDRVLKRPELVEMVFYPDTYHSFDEAGPMREITVRGVGNVISKQMVGYVAPVAEDAEMRTRRFLQKTFQQ